ncbi:response regulator [bacterium]|nr:response regulator [bacterium]
MKNGKSVILCIDDDVDILEALKVILEADDYHVETAHSSAEALQHVGEIKPDLIIVDLMMEEIDSGTQFVTKLRQIGPTPPIYLLSSAGDGLQGAIDYHELGFSGVFQKPLNSASLLKLVREALKQ